MEDRRFVEETILVAAMSEDWDEVDLKLQEALNNRELLELAATLDTLKEHIDAEINRRRK